MFHGRVSMHVREKAQELFDAGAVTPIPGTTYEVKSGENTYVVFVSHDHPMCTCPASSRCSHQEAVAIYNRREIQAMSA